MYNARCTKGMCLSGAFIMSLNATREEVGKVLLLIQDKKRIRTQGLLSPAHLEVVRLY